MSNNLYHQGLDISTLEAEKKFFLIKKRGRVYFLILKDTVLNISDFLPHGVYLDEYMETLNLKLPRLGSDHRK